MTFEGYYHGSENDPQFEVRAMRLTDGLGYGDGKISSATQEQAEGNEDLAQKTDAAIQHPDFLTPISRDENGEQITDDGCGDGRRTGLVFKREENYVDKVYKSSLMRAKVFGGGLVMITVARVGLGYTSAQGLNATIEESRSHMKDKNVNYGAHTVMKAYDGKTGCWAVDEIPSALLAAVKYRNEIRGTVVSLIGEAPELDAITTKQGDIIPGVFDNFAAASHMDNSKYDSRAVINGTVEDGKIVKALADDHLETRIVLNNVEGYTSDQGFVREYTGGRAQVFSVDVWRMLQLAQQTFEDPEEQRRAFLGELVYMLATAAALTNGDLPVYAINLASVEGVK